MKKKQKFIDYELHLQMYNDALCRGSEAHAKHEVGEPIKPKGYDKYKAEQIAKQLAKFEYFERHLKQFNEAKDAYERHFIQEPEKPEGYDEYKAEQEKLLLQKQKKEAEKHNEKQIIENSEIEGYEFDTEGIPKYLTADDVYNGRQNPEWTKKHEKLEQKSHIPTAENLKQENEQAEEIVYNRYSGLEKYLSETDRQQGIINPEWIMEHGK